MTNLQAVILGAIQGLTEFLPVSSSGHLVLCQQFFGLKQEELFFDISVHMGTLVAVMIFFRKEIFAIFNSLFLYIKGFKQKGAKPDENVKLAFLIITGSVPTAIIGLIFKDMADTIFASILLVGCSLIVTGSFLWAVKQIKSEGRGIDDFSFFKSFIIGTIQGLAILPGISRSGSTIAAGLFLGLKREMAARYSFLLSIPAILGAEILSLSDMGSKVSFDNAVIYGTITSFVVGYCSLILLMYIVNKGRIHIFAPYCWILGILAIYAGL